MKKRRSMNKMEPATRQNPVAKYAHQFVKAHVFADKTKYSRKGNRSKQEDFSITLIRVIEKSSCISQFA
jgi:hypothetical protein